MSPLIAMSYLLLYFNVLFALFDKLNICSFVYYMYMQSTKKKVIDIIEKLPNDVEYNEIFEAIYFQQKIELGIGQSEEKKGISHDEVRKRFEKWLK